MSKVYAFDLDETLCTRDKSVDHIGYEKYRYCEPIPEMINKLNKLYNDGNVIYIYTARGMSTFNGDINKVYNKLYNLTLDSLKRKKFLSGGSCPEKSGLVLASFLFLFCSWATFIIEICFLLT